MIFSRFARTKPFHALVISVGLPKSSKGLPAFTKLTTVLVILTKTGVFNMQQLKINSFQKIKYFFRLMCRASIILVLGINLTMLKRNVLDLSMREASLNHIQQHLEYIYCYPMSHESIISIQQEAADKAHPINHTLE